MTDKLRRVVLYKWERDPSGGGYRKVPDGNGLFHQFGMDYEIEDGVPVLYTTAIVELPDGTVRCLPVDCIQFNN